jgi:N-acetylated-alpha-linked acidic dipeptidase
MTAPAKVRLRIVEPPMAADPDSADKHQLPTYNAYSASGDVTAPLVYVNYGIPDDYQQLEKLGIDVKGKIVIARYGASWRGTKVKTAQERGAIGCILYSDPRDDGYFQGDVFPKGPFRPPVSAQRGSVMDMPLYVGDPLSPGFPSEKGGRRIPREQAQTIMKIPVLPISYGEARPLLEQLAGPVAPQAWRGALPITYHVGPGPAAVRLHVDFDWTVKPVYNVIAHMRGSVLPDEWVIYGNHHDAWVNGAADPVSGAVALLETARSAAELRSTGWRPRRSLMFALWDAEEFGLIGSTEWVEKHKAELRQKAIAYLNTDMNAGGQFSAGGSFVLEQLLVEAARDNQDPSTRQPLNPRGKQELSAPGAGSDYVAFVHHAGIPVLNLSFQSPAGSGTYHSILDSFAWFTAHMDRDFAYSRALSQVMITLMLRLSESVLVPVEFTGVERHTRQATEQLQRDAKSLDLGGVQAALDQLRQASERYESAYQEAIVRMESQAALAALNQRLAKAEQVLSSEDGLPGRPWYKHQLYAPGLYTGYSARMIPAVREALDAGNPEEAKRAAEELAQTLTRFAEWVNQLTESLRTAPDL